MITNDRLLLTTRCACITAGTYPPKGGHSQLGGLYPYMRLGMHWRDKNDYLTFVNPKTDVEKK